MKWMIYLVTSIFLTSQSYAQCKDVYGHKTECPTESDSLTLYNNALKVYDYYENNSKYQRTRQREIQSEMDKRDIFEDLATARRLFFVIRRQFGTSLNQNEKKFAAGKPVPSYKDISYNQYYQEIDDYRFYQRELENQIVNIGAPISLFDTRIAPIIVNEYRCIDSTDSHFGDLVNIVLYVPVTVKPIMLLTEDELESRNKILSKIDANYKPIVSQKLYHDISKTESKISDTLIARFSKDTSKNTIVKKQSFEKYDYIPKIYEKCKYSIPMYAYNPSRGGTIIGFICGKTFIKIKPSEYKYYAVPDWAKIIIENEDTLTKLLKNKFGEYIKTVE